MKKKHMLKADFVNEIRTNRRYHIVFAAICSLVLNLIYALCNGVLGIAESSVWFITLCAYYIILSVMRFGAVMCERRSSSEIFVTRLSGALLIILSMVISGSVYLSLTNDVAVRHGEIVMIAIASYTFYKTVLAIINAVKVRKTHSALLGTIRGISCADAAVSMLSLQRSMLVSFGGMEERQIYFFNASLGAAVCLFIFVLGISMILKSLRR